MPTRNVVITDHQQEMIEDLVSTGHYQNASEVLREGLRMLERREEEDAARLQVLRAAVGTGLDDLDNRRFVELDEQSLDGHITDLLERSRHRSEGRAS